MQWLAMRLSASPNPSPAWSNFTSSKCFPSVSVVKIQFLGDVTLSSSLCCDPRVAHGRLVSLLPMLPGLVSAVSPRSRQEWLLLHNLPNSFGDLVQEYVPDEAASGHSVGGRDRVNASTGALGTGDFKRENVHDFKEDSFKASKRSGQGGVWRTQRIVEARKSSAPRILHHGETGNFGKERKYRPAGQAYCGKATDTLQSTKGTSKIERKARRKGKIKIWRQMAKDERHASMAPEKRRQSLELSETTPAVDGIRKRDPASLYRSWVDPEDWHLVGPLQEPGTETGEPSKVIEVWKKGRLVKRYLPLGVEFLYGRTKPTRIYGPLNSRGEVPNSGLAPVPKKYRDRCDNQNGWTIKETVMKILELNHWDDIDSVLNHWVGRFNRKNFFPIMMAMTRTGALKHSVRLFTWMKTQRCYRAQTDIYNLMIWLYTRHNRVDRARSLFAEMQVYRCKPDLETYNALINVHGRVGQWRESLCFFNRMLRAAVPPSTGTYNNLINACGSSGHWEKALEIYRKMDDDGVKMDVVTHNTVLTALKIGQQYAMAVDHFEKMLNWEICPSRVTLNIIISCFSKMERYDEAVQLFNSMKSLKWERCNPDLVTFTTVMHVYAACGQVDNVKAVFDMMISEGVVPNIVSYNTLIGAYASFGMDVEALEIFNSMSNVGFEPDVVSYTTLMNAYSKSGKPDETAKVFDLMKRKSRKPNVVTYNTLIYAYSSAGRVDEALGLLLQMDIDDISPTVVTVCSLIVACGCSGQIEKVGEVLKAAAERKVSLNVNVCNTALSVYLNGGMYKEARRLYTAMKEENVHPNAITFAIMINGAAKVGNIFEAEDHFNEMLSLNIGLSVEACSALIHAYAEQGMAKEAHALVLRMKEADCAPNVMTYTSLIHAYSTAGMYQDAVEMFEEMETMGVVPDVAACSALFTVLNRCGQGQKMIMLWSKWREHLQFGATAYKQLSRACSMLRDWVTALKLWEDMLRLGVIPDSNIGNNVLRCLSKCGKAELLKKVFSQLQDLGTMATKETYNILIDCYSRTQNWRECLETFDRFETNNIEPDLKTYKMLLRCLEKAQLPEMYLEVYNQMTTKGYFLDFDVPSEILVAFKERHDYKMPEELNCISKDSRQREENVLREALNMLS